MTWSHPRAILPLGEGIKLGRLAVGFAVFAVYIGGIYGLKGLASVAWLARGGPASDIALVLAQLGIMAAMLVAVVVAAHLRLSSEGWDGVGFFFIPGLIAAVGDAYNVFAARSG